VSLLLDGDCVPAALFVEGGEKVERKLTPLVLVPRGGMLLLLPLVDDDVPVPPGVAAAAAVLLCSVSREKHKHNKQTQ
jgi:hypothetical protein